MPIITFESGELAEDVKSDLIQKLTEVSAEITGIPKASFIVALRELPDQNIALGGVTVKEIKERSGRI